MNRFPPKKILVAFDFSAPALAAWRYALTLAGRVKASVEAVYVRPSFMGPEVVMPLTLSAQERRKLEQDARLVLGGRHRVHIDDGDVVLGILRAARARKADLLVAGTSGLKGLARLSRSSVSEELVRSSPVPVLAVHKDSPLPGSILAPVNLKAYSFQGLEFAERVARSLKARVTMLHVREKEAGQPIGRLHVEARKKRQAPVELVTAAGKPVEVILKAAKEHDLVVLVAHRGGLFRAAILGTTAEQVLRRASVPVLTLPPEAGSARGSRRR